MILLIATLCLPLLLLVAARLARAETPRVDGLLPCSAAQLRRALSLRLPRGQRAKLASVRVRALGARNALIQLRGKQRVVPLLGLRGAAAARRLALGVMDLLRAPTRRRPAAARWGARSVAAPLALTLALQGLPAGASPRRDARLTELAAELKRFKHAARSYRQTVRGIVRRSYTHRRRAMLSGNARNLGLKEAEERLRRLAAITLFEGFLRRYPNDRRWTPDVIFRLAELYFERANDRFLQAMARYDAQMSAFDAGRRAAAPALPRADYRETIALHSRLIRDFPRYRLLDGALYLLGFCLSETGQLERGRQAFLALVCADQHRPPLQSTHTSSPRQQQQQTRGLQSRVPAAATAATDRPHPYTRCKPRVANSRFASEAWVRVGEHHFDEGQLAAAIAAYQQVVRRGPSKSNPYYDSALYKLAWAFYRADRYQQAIAHFDRLVLFADRASGAGRSGPALMRPESIQYLGVCFAEHDWDGDTRPDPASGLQRLETFYKGRGAQRHVYEVYQRLAQIYFDTTRYEEALVVMNKLLTRWPLRPENPEVLDRIVRALQRLRRFDQALRAQGRFASLFGPGTAWARRNVKRAAAARALQRQHLVAAAAAHHGAARTLREGGNPAAARPRYARAAQLYGALLGPLDRANKVDLELRHARAFCLFHAGELTLAAAAFGQVRDGGASRVMLEEAALMAIKAQEAQIDALVKAGRLTRPPLPEPPPAAAASPGPVPAAFARLQAALDAHVRLLPHSPRTPTLRYKAAEVPYRFSRFAEARPRLQQVYRKHCAHPIAVSAAQALLTSYRLTGPRAQMQTWTERLRTGACGGRSGLAVRAKEQAQRYHDGQQFKRALALLQARRWSRAAKAFVDLVKTNPASELQVRALQNAGLCHEQLKQHATAAAIYARIWQEHRASKAAPRALWRAALNRQRAHDFAGAIGAFTTLADQPLGSPHRLEALYNAGVLLAQDKQHRRAAAALLRYASSVSGATRAAAREAAQAIYLAAIQLEQAKQPAAAARTLHRFVRRHGAQPGQGPRIVQAHAGLARLADARGDQARARRAHAAAVAAYARHKLSPAADGAAEAAAASAFWLAERELERFLRLTIRGSVAALGRQRRRMERQAAALKRRYEAVYAYKRARWTLAALFRQGVLLEHLARQVDAGFRNAPIPTAVRRLGPAAVQLYLDRLQQELASQVDPLANAARRTYAECVKRAAELKIQTKHTRAARKKLEAFGGAPGPDVPRPPRPAKLERVLE